MNHFGVIKCCFLALLFSAIPPHALGHGESGDDGVASLTAIQCATIRYHKVFIDTTIAGLCGPEPTPEPEPVSNPVEWESIPLTSIGVINLGITSDQVFNIPNTVPNTANEVLLYVFVRTGNTHGGVTHVRIFTQENTNRRFEKYLTSHAYPQDAHTYTADNMWFPLTSERRVHAILSNAIHTRNTEAKVFIIGYR